VIGYYTSVQDGRRAGFLLGPFPTHDEALDLVEFTLDLAADADPFSHFYAFGTCRVEADEDALPVGRLNGYISKSRRVT